MSNVIYALLIIPKSKRNERITRKVGHYIINSRHKKPPRRAVFEFFKNA